MSYLDTLSKEQKTNIGIITEEAKKQGITNPNTIAGMLAIVSKESAFIPREEKSYAGTSNSRIRKVFGSRVPSSDSALNTLKANPKQFFDRIYGDRYGNSADEGYKYRGRGFNQLTFKGNYEKFGDNIGVDLVKNPDKVNNVRTAAKVLIAYNKEGIDSLKKHNKLSAYNAENINDFKTPVDSTLAFYHATAGSGKDISYVKGLQKNDHLGGMTKALKRVNELLLASKMYVKKNKFKTVLVVSITIIAIYSLVKILKK